MSDHHPEDTLDAKPRFSVLVPAYNAEATLAETVASVREQTFSDWELVIVDDGSTDSTPVLAADLAAADSRIQVVTQANRGTGGAYNTAVRSARADLLVMLSADDLLFPEHLTCMDAYIRVNPDASIFTCDGYFKYEDGRLIPQDLNDRWRASGECTLADLCEACFFGIGGVFRREVFDTVGGFREDLYAEDYLFWLLALAHGYRHRYLNTPLAVHRRFSAQKSADTVRMRKADVRTLQELVASGLLSADALRVAQANITRLERLIWLRTVLTNVLGESLTERLIATARGRHSGGRR